MPVSPAQFPTITSGQVAKYPLTRRRVRRTTVYTFVDFSEQRFAKGSPLAQFDLTFNNVTTVDKEILRTFFDDHKGALDVTWAITLQDPPGPDVEYVHMQFVPHQPFLATNTTFNRWNVILKIRQTRLN